VNPAVLWLNVISDLTIAAACCAIPVVLLRLWRRRRDLAFDWVLAALAAFILACGTTHLLEAISVWKSYYPLAGLAKALTALVSVATAVALVPLVRKLVALPSPSQLAAPPSVRDDDEGALRDSEARLTRMIDSAMDGVISTDEKQLITFFNPSAEQMFGCSAAEVIGHPLSRLIPERFRTAHAAHVHAFGRSHFTRRKRGDLGTVYGLRANGEEFPIEASISRVEVAGRQTFTAILRDITARKEAEDLLREERDFSAALVDSLPGVMYLFDAQGQFLRWNNNLAVVTGYSADEIARMQPLDFFRGPERGLITERIAEAFAQGHTTAEAELVFKDGSHRPYFFTGFRVALPRGPCLVGMGIDITDRKRAEEEVRTLNADLERRVRDRTAQLEASNKELEAFAYSVSHDLRAPLRVIDGWSLALLEDCGGQLDEQARQRLGRVRAETQRMGTLIDDLLQLSRLTRTEMQFLPVDLTSIARTIAARLQEANAGRQLDFVVQSKLTALGDSRLLEIALTNLMGNAVKFTRPRDRATIEFGLIERDGEPAFYVRDNGVGFDMAYVGTLFVAFQRLHKPSEFPGTGIGLATVQRVIRRHRGRVWAEARPDQGATFYFNIPEAA
jgi:PAS domain S-box-containing protein